MNMINVLRGSSLSTIYVVTVPCWSHLIPSKPAAQLQVSFATHAPLTQGGEQFTVVR